VELVDLVPKAKPLGELLAEGSRADRNLIVALHKRRNEFAKLATVPGDIVMSDWTLLEIAKRRPTNSKALLAIPGFGVSDLETHGPEIIGMVQWRPRSEVVRRLVGETGENT
jgi:superfamily II DNA helicase RecQ